MQESIESLYDRKKEYVEALEEIRRVEEFEKRQVHLSKLKSEVQYYYFQMEEIESDPEKSKFLTQSEKEKLPKIISKLNGFIEKLGEHKEQTIREKLRKLDLFLRDYNVKKETFENNRHLRVLVHKSSKELENQLEQAQANSKWIPKTKIRNFKKMISDFEQQFTQSLDEQKEMDLSQMPLVTEHQIQQSVQQIKAKILSLKEIQKDDKNIQEDL